MFLSEKRKKRDMILKRVLKMEVYNIIFKRKEKGVKNMS